ncbi:STN domain-containing protein [Bradyrhizobium sp. 2TAF24]|uniref:STN domain-containing protein n=1 Tax=Bradyrhizobium sp. 2TAF24 TaxID=3233011 RepID=UPI003F926684
MNINVLPCLLSILAGARGGVLAMLLAIAIASGGASGRAAEPIVAFDIPAGDLDAALNAYIGASGMQLLYETRLTEGRHSSAVKGRLAPDVALRMLLAGSGLVARRIEVETFSITVAPRSDGMGQAIPVARDRPFVGALQATVIDSLCRDARTRPGDYRIAFELWIDAAGAVARSSLIGSTGSRERDDALRQALLGVTVRAAPPADLPQPVIMTIARRSPGEPGDCRPTVRGAQ